MVMTECAFCGDDIDTFIGILNGKDVYWCHYCKEETVEEDDEENS